MQITKHNAATTVDITTNAVQTDVIDWAYTEVFLDSVTTVTEYVQDSQTWYEDCRLLIWVIEQNGV